MRFCFRKEKIFWWRRFFLEKKKFFDDVFFLEKKKIFFWWHFFLEKKIFFRAQGAAPPKKSVQVRLWMTLPSVSNYQDSWPDWWTTILLQTMLK